MHRQALEAAYESTSATELQERIMDDVIKVIADYRKYDYAPELCRAVHLVVKQTTGNEDPYRDIKDFDIKEAKKLESEIRGFIMDEKDT